MRMSLVLLMLAMSGSLIVDAGETPIVPTVIQALRAADEARSQQGRERERWLRERAELEQWARGLEDQTSALEEQLTTQASALAALREAVTAAPPDHAAPIIALRQALGRPLHALLQQLWRDSVLAGVIEEPGALPQTITPKQLQAWQAQLQGLEQAARSYGLLVVESHQADGSTRAVQVLHAGGLAAWWRGLDGQTAGRAERRAGRWQALPARDEAETNAIHTAFAIVEGLRAPILCRLPLAIGAHP